MKIYLNKHQNNLTANIATRCPHCGHNGTFIAVGAQDVVQMTDDGRNPKHLLGIRKCPNDKCKGHLFFIADTGNNIVLTSPSETIPFDKENIPENVLNAFDEAVNCHANNNFIASAIMIRKTLEEICFDRGAGGQNLQLRLKDLGGKIQIPKELLEGMDDLRLLGNDAAHIESKTYNEIGKDEIEVSLEFAKEILKAVYQYDALLKKLKKMKEVREKRAPTPAK